MNGDVAGGHWHLIALSKWPNGRPIEDNDGHWSLAIYNVEFQRTSDGWRFTRMVLRRGRVDIRRTFLLVSDHSRGA